MGTLAGMHSVADKASQWPTGTALPSNYKSNTRLRHSPPPPKLGIFSNVRATYAGMIQQSRFKAG